MRTAVLPTHANLPATIFTLLDCLKNSCKGRRILFIGNSAINRGMITYFLRKGDEDLTLCTRSEKVPFPSIKLKEWESLDNWFDYDVVIAGTYHHEYILKQNRALEDLKSQTVLFDLGVPRNIDPGLKSHPLLHLYNIDELSQMTNRAKKTSEKEIQLCETMVEKAVERQIELFHLKQQARWRYVAPCEKLAILP